MRRSTGLVLVLGLIWGGCDAGEITGGELDETDPAYALTCPAGTTTAIVSSLPALRTEPRADAPKVQWAPLAYGQTVCVIPDEAGLLERVGGTYSASYGDESIWFEVSTGTKTGYVAGAYLRFPDPPRARKVVFYVQALIDTDLAPSMKAFPGVVPVVTDRTFARIQAAADTSAELAAVIREKMAEVEAMGPVEITLVISGHSSGTTIFGYLDDNDHSKRISIIPTPEAGWGAGSIILEELAAEHPVFASQVRHIMLLCCNAVWPANADLWRSPYPSTTTVSGFAGTGPAGGAAYVFFKASFGKLSSLPACIPNPQMITNSFPRLWPDEDWPDNNWAHRLVSRCDSGTFLYYNAKNAPSIYQAREDYDYSLPYFQKYLAATEDGYADPPDQVQVQEVDGHPTPRRHYLALHAFLSAIALGNSSWYYDADDVALLELERAVALRLTFFHEVKAAWLADPRNAPTFATWLRTNAAAAQAALAAATGAPGSVGVTADLLEGLDRRTTIRFLSELHARLPSDTFVGRMETAFVDLDPAELPDEYL